MLVALLLAASPLGLPPFHELAVRHQHEQERRIAQRPMQIVILLTLLTILPAVVMSITRFLRIAIVLHFLRQALGTQTTPSNQVLLGSRSSSPC